MNLYFVRLPDTRLALAAPVVEHSPEAYESVVACSDRWVLEINSLRKIFDVLV